MPPPTEPHGVTGHGDHGDPRANHGSGSDARGGAVSPHLYRRRGVDHGAGAGLVQVQMDCDHRITMHLVWFIFPSSRCVLPSGVHSVDRPTMEYFPAVCPDFSQLFFKTLEGEPVTVW